MRAALSWGVLAAAACAVPAASQPLTTVMDTVTQPDSVDRTIATQDFDFGVDRAERMRVPVWLGGNGPYRFLVDTGADRTAISTALAIQLALPPGPTATLHSVTGTSQVRTARVERLELSPDRVRSVDAALLDRTHMGADGILGVDSLRSQRVVFDFKNQVMSIVPSARRLERDDGDVIVVNGKLRRGHLILTKATVNGFPVTIVLDTGSEMTMGNSALRRKLAMRSRLGAPERMGLMSVTGGKLVGEALFIKEVKMGEVSLNSLAVVFSDAPIFRSLGFEDRPTMLLGMNAMRAFDKVSIDFAKKKLRMILPEHSSRQSSVMAAR